MHRVTRIDITDYIREIRVLAASMSGVLGLLADAARHDVRTRNMLTLAAGGAELICDKTAALQAEIDHAL